MVTKPIPAILMAKVMVLKLNGIQTDLCGGQVAGQMILRKLIAGIIITPTENYMSPNTILMVKEQVARVSISMVNNSIHCFASKKKKHTFQGRKLVGKLSSKNNLTPM